MGASDSDLAWLDEEEAIAKEGIFILKPNAVVFSVFTSCNGQWNTAISPMGQMVRTGLRLPDVEVRARHMAAYRALSEAEQDQLWRDLISMQNHALEKFAEINQANAK